MNRQDQLIEQFRKAIEQFDEKKLEREGKHPKMVKAMKESLVSVYEDLKEERDNHHRPAHKNSDSIKP